MTSTLQFLYDRFQSAKGEIAFSDDDKPYTYHWVLDRTPEYTAFLERTGICAGDTVVLVADYSPDVFCLMLAGIERGIIFAPLTRDSVVERDAVLEISECKWFLEFSPVIEEIKVTHYDRQPTNPILTKFLDANEAGLLLFSSGSTGKPKGILHRFPAVLRKFHAQRAKVVAITFLSLDHFGGINTLFHIVSNLGTVVTVRHRTVATICEAIQKHKVELLPTTPSFLNILVHADVGNRYDLSSLKTISYGTEVMPQATLDRLQALFPNVKLQQTYGLSEVGVLRSQSRPDGSLWFKIGGEGFETKIVDDILWIKSDYAMVGYLNAPPPFDADGWFNTQDRVEVDGDYVKILGRITDLINVGGQKVYPSEIEEVIIGLDNVEDVAVCPEKNALLGNLIVAQVVLKEPEDANALRLRVRKACAAVLAPFKVPAKVVVSEKGLYSSRLKKMRRML
jgi:acyl-CoA synthetase (AMP-forming)/AMP-acid ligase II